MINMEDGRKFTFTGVSQSLSCSWKPWDMTFSGTG